MNSIEAKLFSFDIFLFFDILIVIIKAFKMNPIEETVPLYLNTPTYLNNEKLDRISFDIVECDTLFSILINEKIIMQDIPKNDLTNPLLREYKELLFALKTTMLIINAEVFGSDKEPNAVIVVRIEKHSPQDVGIGIKVYEDKIESLSGVVRITNEV
jgi:hypothetical protein